MMIRTLNIIKDSNILMNISRVETLNIQCCKIESLTDDTNNEKKRAWNC